LSRIRSEMNIAPSKAVPLLLSDGAAIDKERASEASTLKATEQTNKDKMDQIDGKAAPSAPAAGLVGEVIRLHQDLNKTQRSDSEDLAKVEEETNAKLNEATTVKNDNVRKRGASQEIKDDFERGDRNLVSLKTLKKLDDIEKLTKDIRKRLRRN